MLISVFTPTYNRGPLLHRVYESLQRQSFRDFEWLIVDDGSVDDTELIVKEWIGDEEMKVESGKLKDKFPIRYVKKENGGKHTAVNLGVKEARGELFFIVDSDDYLTDDALTVVAEEYEKVKEKNDIGGVCGLDMFADGRVIGKLSVDEIDCNAMEIRYKHRVKGDLKEVFRSDVLRDFPFPEIKGEWFCPEQLVWFRIAQKYMLHYFNKTIYVAEYQEGGLTDGITKARMNSPIASCMTYGEMLDYDISFAQKMKAAINYWRFHACMNEINGQRLTVNGLWNLFRPLGWLMHKRDMKKIG